MPCTSTSTHGGYGSSSSGADARTAAAAAATGRVIQASAALPWKGEAPTVAAPAPALYHRAEPCGSRAADSSSRSVPGGGGRCPIGSGQRKEDVGVSTSALGSSSGITERKASAAATVFQALKSSATGGHARATCAYCDRDIFPSKLEEHEDDCKHESTWCENKCGKLVERYLMDSHVTSECSKRLVACSACSKKFVFDTLQTHHVNCPRLPVPCPNRCESTLLMPREDMDKHLEYLCPQVRLPCSFKEVGCTFKGCRRELDIHQLEATARHLSLACEVIGQQRQELRALRSLTTVPAAASCTGGELYWRIPEFRRKLAECKAASAAGGPATDAATATAAAVTVTGELISPPFYTSPGGYKLAVSAFPNGNGSGEGEYLSLYIKVLPGEFDHVLEWPFPLTVTFTVYDQCPRIGRVNIIESFVPDPTWKHFQKPPRDGYQTLGFGYPRFVSHTELKAKNYLRDDTLLIRVCTENAERLHAPQA